MKALLERDEEDEARLEKGEEEEEEEERLGGAAVAAAGRISVGKGGSVAPAPKDLAISSRLFLNSSSLKEERSATLPKWLKSIMCFCKVVSLLNPSSQVGHLKLE